MKEMGEEKKKKSFCCYAESYDFPAHTSSTIIKFWMSCCTFRHFPPVEISHLGNITCRKWYFGVNAAANRAVQWCLLYLFTLWQNVNIFLIVFVCTILIVHILKCDFKNNKDLLDFFVILSQSVFISWKSTLI